MITFERRVRKGAAGTYILTIPITFIKTGEIKEGQKVRAKLE